MSCLVERQLQRIESEFDILEDGEPRIKCKGLENDGNPLGRSAERLSSVQYLARGRLDEPPAMRSNVDLPDPERPRRPRISPSASVMSISVSTASGSPDGFAKAMQTLRISITVGSAVAGMSCL